jgi:hypothetical protein
MSGARTDHDRLDGGTGNDRMDAGYAQRTDLACGPGREIVDVTDAAPAVPASDCETLRLGVATLRFARGRTLVMGCPRLDGPAGRCTASVRVGRRRAVRATARLGGVVRVGLGRPSSRRVRLELVFEHPEVEPARGALSLSLPR